MTLNILGYFAKVGLLSGAVHGSLLPLFGGWAGCWG